MSHYRKIDVRIWNDRKFNNLTIEGKMAFIFILTHPNLTSVGAMRGTIEGLSAELKVFPEAFQEVLEEGMAEADPKANLIHAKNFLKYNKPESPNVVKAWGKAFDMLPECKIKTDIFEAIKGSIKDYGKAFQKAFKEAFPQDLP